MNEKFKRLIKLLSDCERLAVAFSGGVDSAMLLKAAALALPAENILALTARGPFFPERESRQAETLAAELGIEQVVLEADMLALPEVAANPPDRCYHCKKNLFSLMRGQARQRGFQHLADGGNLDDLDDYRPGGRAVAELGVLSPLQLAGLRKDEIRRLSAELGLASWDKPAFACLASRIPYGQTISREKLLRVEKAEDYLLSLGFRQVRVRDHDRLARVEVEAEERSRFFDQSLMDRVDRQLKDLGFLHVALDLAGYRGGSLNAALDLGSS